MVSYSCRTDNTNTNFFYNRKTRLLSENESLFSKVLQCRSCGPGYRCILKRVCFYHMMSLFFVMLTSSLPQREKRVKGIVGKLTEMEPDTFFSSDSSGFLFLFCCFPNVSHRYLYHTVCHFIYIPVSTTISKSFFLS